MTLREISAILKISHVTVINFMNKYDIKRRTNSESLMGHKLTTTTKEKIRNSHSGKSLTQSHKKNISTAMKLIDFRPVIKYGEQSHNWKGGLPKCLNCGKELKSTSAQRCLKCNGEVHSKKYRGKLHWNYIEGKSIYTAEFSKRLKDKIRQRDNFTCQKCEETEEYHLIVYGKVLSVHHIDYDKQNCKEDNLITLCSKCHTITNYNREYWIEYFTSKKEKNK